MSEQSLRLSQKGGIQSYAKNVNIPSEQLVLEDKRKYIWKGTEGCTLESLMRSRASKGNKVTTVSSCFFVRRLQLHLDKMLTHCRRRAGIISIDKD